MILSGSEELASSGEEATKQGDAQSEEVDIDPFFGDLDREVGPMDELEEVPIDEHDTTKVIKVGKISEVSQSTTGGVYTNESRCLCLVAQGYGGYLTNCDQPCAQRG